MMIMYIVQEEDDDGGQLIQSDAESVVWSQLAVAGDAPRLSEFDVDRIKKKAMMVICVQVDSK